MVEKARDMGAVRVLMGMGVRRDGMRKLRRIETAIVVWWVGNGLGASIVLSEAVWISRYRWGRFGFSLHVTLYVMKDGRDFAAFLPSTLLWYQSRLVERVFESR